MTAKFANIKWCLGLACTALVFAENPVVTHRQLADPNGFVFENRLYAICSNDDDNGSSYDMQSAVVISTNDLVNWTDHGDVFRTTRDAKWASGSYAPTAIAAKGKVYLYFPNVGAGVGVLIADRPEGPYKDPLGKALIGGSTYCPMSMCFDPVIFMDDDTAASAYLVWGGGTPFGSNFRGIALNPDMISVKGTMTTPESPNSFEGPFVHKYKGNYYLHYPVHENSDIEYGMSSTSPISGYTRKGVLLPNPTLNGQNINVGSNSHESVFEYKGNWYMMYHDRRLPTGNVYKRDVSIDKLEYNADGTMKQVVVTTGMAQIADFNPYDSIPAATMSKQSGIKASFDPTTWTNYLVPQISGAWIRLSGVDFKDGAKQFQVNAATTVSDIRVEVHTGSATGPLAGTCAIVETGSMAAFATSTCDLSGLTGVTDVYLKFVGAASNTNFAWYRFVPGSMATKPVAPAFSPNARSAFGREFSVFDLHGRLQRHFLTERPMAAQEAWKLNSTTLPVGLYVMTSESTVGVRSGTFLRTPSPGKL